MNIEEFREYCLSKPLVTEEFPFDSETLVFKLGCKIFALTSLESPDFKVNLKCEPVYAQELREKFEEIKPGYHMNKLHWNTVDFDKNLENKFLKDLIDHSYDLIYKKLPKNIKSLNS